METSAGAAMLLDASAGATVPLEASAGAAVYVGIACIIKTEKKGKKRLVRHTRQK